MWTQTPKSTLNIHWKDWCWNWSSNTLVTLHHVKSKHIGKDPGAGKDWRQKEKGAAEDEMVGQLRLHYWLKGYEFEETPGDSEGQGSLVCCTPWGCKELGMTERLNRQTETLHRELVLCFSQDRSFPCVKRQSQVTRAPVLTFMSLYSLYFMTGMLSPWMFFLFTSGLCSYYHQGDHLDISPQRTLA